MANTARNPQTGRFIPKEKEPTRSERKGTTRQVPSKASTRKGETR